MPRRPPASRNLVAPIQRSLPACGRVGFGGGRALRLVKLRLPRRRYRAIRGAGVVGRARCYRVDLMLSLPSAPPFVQPGVAVCCRVHAEFCPLLRRFA